MSRGWVLLAGLLLAGPARAEGRFGLGSESALGFYGASGDLGAGFGAFGLRRPGLSLVYHATDRFGVQAIVSAGTVNTRDEVFGADVRATTTWVNFAGRGHLGIDVADDARLGLVFGAGVAVQSASVVVGDTRDTSGLQHVSAEVGIRPEWFVAPALSIHTQVGVVFSALDEDGGGQVVFDVLGAADLLGSAGFTFWFD